MCFTKTAFIHEVTNQIPSGKFIHHKTIGWDNPLHDLINFVKSSFLYLCLVSQSGGDKYISALLDNLA